MTEEASRILSEAGWTADAGWGGFTYGTCVGGLAPDGNVYVKNWAAIQPGHPKYGPDTPDTAEEAARWLADRYKAPVVETNALSLDSLEFRIEDEIDGLLRTHLAPVSEEGESLQDESNGETGEEASSGNASNELGAESDLSVRLPAGLGDLDAGSAEGVDVSGDVYAEHERAESDLIDADFTIEDLGGPDETLELPAPDPEDFAPEDFAHEPEPEAPQDRFIGLDDLDRVRSLRIGDVATEALRLTTMIEQAVSEQEGEFSNIQAYVVSNLDKHTGAFTPQDDASRATYGRFLELSSARSKIALIDARRKDATALLIAAGRDEVVSFDVRAAFA